MVACCVITPSVIKVISLLIPLSYVAKGHLQPFQVLCALHNEHYCHLHHIITKQNIMTPFDCESGSCINIYPSRKSTEPVFVLKCSGWLFVHFFKGWSVSSGGRQRLNCSGWMPSLSFKSVIKSTEEARHRHLKVLLTAWLLITVISIITLFFERLSSKATVMCITVWLRITFTPQVFANVPRKARRCAWVINGQWENFQRITVIILKMWHALYVSFEL